MTPKIKLFKSKERKVLDDVSSILHELADKISEGEIILKRGEEQTTLHLPKNVTLEIEADEQRKPRERVKQSLEIEITWYQGEEGNDDQSFEIG